MAPDDKLTPLYNALSAARVAVDRLGHPTIDNMTLASLHERLEGLRELIYAIEPAYEVALVALEEEEYADANGRTT